MPKKTQSVKSLAIVIIVLLAVNLLFSAINIFDKNGPSNALSMEQLKAWGEENFEIMKQIFESPTYKEQQKSNLLQTLQTFGWEVNKETVETNTEKGEETVTVENDKDMIEQFAKIMDDAHIVWNKDARFTILEYSELFCPYCKRQHNEGNINAVLEEFDGEVNSAFRNFIVHPGAKKFAEAGECIADLEGTDAHIEFIDKAFNLNSAINDTTLESILDEMWIKSKKINDCIDKGTFSSKVDAQTQEGRTLFAVKGTPGNVIIDHETGRFILIPGAYPASKFIEEINNLMK